MERPLIAIVPESEWSTPTLIGFLHATARVISKTIDSRFIPYIPSYTISTFLSKENGSRHVEFFTGIARFSHFTKGSF